ncbi:MAG: YbaB/EbfC family nucleoid-associated protein [Devosia sp.]|uniref:YbaB/EbfC family nucleoid-associated protein n=1 Tax=Devosia sp. TaxID=1871048 RepID=UPI001AD57E36|nr:YbaB/EbfC family nucleoid-associated protein [Devosia sp.]MBN9314909.1 YbaB/EbfC family nucleoid-associated protein [Devosia sp.]
MKDLMNMMKAAQEMKGRMEELQARIAEMVIEGRSGGGLVVVTLNGKGEMKGLKIDKSLVSDDVSVLEDLIIAAHNDAKGKVEYETNAKMQEVTAGLPIPPGLKFPF